MPDPRLANWPAAGGIVAPVLFTARSGATLSGHVWATRSGPAKRAGVLVINGSNTDCEQIFWFKAQTLAKAGFVVLTFDVQGEGMSDQFGEAPDQREAAFAGLPGLGLLAPAPSVGGSGLPFYDGGEDALDFFLSTPAHPFVPVPSRSSGTSHAPKQQRRAAAGLNAAYNPLWEMLDPGAIGLNGHSFGSMAASWLGQQDPRVKAVATGDSLCVPVWPSPDEAVAFAAPVNSVGGLVPVPGPVYGLPPECFGAPQGPAPPITKPALGMNADYLLQRLPYAAPPRPGDKSQSTLAYSAAGVDTANIVIRGGVHADFGDPPPSGMPAIDMITWYTTAWFAKYLQHNPDADRMLLSARWRDNTATGTVDPGGDANLYSWHYTSRLAITLANGQRYNCENLRNGCVGQYKASEDCGPVEYSFAAVSNAPGAGPPVVCEPARKK